MTTLPLFTSKSISLKTQKLPRRQRKALWLSLLGPGPGPVGSWRCGRRGPGSRSRFHNCTHRCPWHALTPQFPPPKVQLVLGQGWSARQSRRGGPAPRTSALHSPLFQAVSGPVQVAGDSCALSRGRPRPMPQGPRSPAMWVWGLSRQVTGSPALGGPWGPTGHAAGRQAVRAFQLSCPTASQPLGPALNSVAGTQCPGVKGQQRPWTLLPGAGQDPSLLSRPGHSAFVSLCFLILGCPRVGCPWCLGAHWSLGLARPYW